MIQITRGDKRLDKLLYVAKAIPKDDSRYCLNYLYIPEDANRAIGTDGHRLHVAMLGNQDDGGLLGERLEPGYYSILKRTKTQLWLEKENVDAKYPNVDQFFDDMPKNDEDWLTVGGTQPESHAAYLIAKHFDMCVNVYYLADTVSYGAPFQLGKYTDRGVWCWFDEGEVVGLVMSMRV